MGVSRRSRVPERITRPDERFDSSQVGLHVPNCELFAGRSQYRPAGGNRVRLPLPAVQTNRPTKEGAYSDMVVAVLSFAK